MADELLGPFQGPYGEPVTFLVCTEGERVRAFIGPFYSDASVAADLDDCAKTGSCKRAHFRTSRIPRDGVVVQSMNYVTREERLWVYEWVRVWWSRQEMCEV